MSPNEQYYRKMMGTLGATMLLFLLFLNVFGIASLIVSEIMPPSTWGNIIDQLIYAAVYMASFLLPIPCFRALAKKIGHSPVPIKATPKMSPFMPLILFAALAIVLAAANINSFFVSIFDYSDFSNEVLWGDVSRMSPYEIVLQFIVMCLVPGICEEFLFRGTILTNCLPFGRSRAIFISALLFALMHQNSEQIFYTFVAGIILGVLYEYTGSIWNCVLLHIMNNFLSLFTMVLGEYYQWTPKAELCIFILNAVVYLLGTVSAVILIVRFFSEKKSFRDGIFEKDFPAADHYAACPIEHKRAVKLFFTPTMIVFLVLSLAQILLLILGAMLYVG